MVPPCVKTRFGDRCASHNSTVMNDLESISVVVPAYNEGSELASVLRQLHTALAELAPRYDVELVIVDDGSRDETPAVIAAFAAAHPEGTITRTHPLNRGLTEALKTGARAARGATVVMLDADLSYSPDIVEPLARTLRERGAAAVLASPYMRGGRVANVPLDRLIASRGANLLLSASVGFTLHTLTGMVRAYETQTLLGLIERPVRGEFNAWIVAELLRSGRRVVEIPAALVWPRARTEAAPRLTRAKLWDRTKLVVATLGVLVSARGGRRTAGSP